MDNKSFEMINRCKEYLNRLGVITHRAMFGGYALAIRDVVFAMVSEGHLYLRACSGNTDYFDARHLPTLGFYKRGRRITLNYYLVDQCLWEDIPELIQLAAASLLSAQHVKAMQHSCLRLKDLPNLTLKMEVRLYQAGICDIPTLKAFGARTCWLKMRAQNKALSIRLLFALEGAIAMVLQYDVLS